MTDMDDSELYSKFQEFIEAAAEVITEQEVPIIPVHVVKARDDFFQTETQRRRSLVHLIRERFRTLDHEVALEEEKAFKSYLEAEYDVNISSQFAPLYTAVFGESCEYIDCYEERMEAEYEKLKRNLESGTVTYFVKSFLNGIDLEDEVVDISDTIRLREPTDEDLTYEVESLLEVLPNISSSVPHSDIINSVVLEFEIEAPLGALAGSGQIQLKNLCTALRLFDTGNVSQMRTEYDPETILGAFHSSRPASESRSSLPSSTVQSGDGDQIRELYELISPHYDTEERDYDYPISAAIDHFETSLEKRTYTRESVTFGVIGLEALYGGRKGTVTAYCPLLLGTVSEEFEAMTVRENLRSAYRDHRNQWAHGGRRKSGGKEVQGAVWDYLRSSIVIFLAISDSKPFNKKERDKLRSLLEKATIDEEGRKELVERTKDLDLNEFLRNIGSVEVP